MTETYLDAAWWVQQLEDFLAIPSRTGQEDRMAVHSGTVSAEPELVKARLGSPRIYARLFDRLYADPSPWI